MRAGWTRPATALAVSALVLSGWAALSPAAEAFDPTSVKPLSSTIAAGADHVVWIDGTGKVWGVGYDGSQYDAYGTGTSTPVLLGPTFDTKALSVSAAGSSTIAVMDNGMVYAMGENANGELSGRDRQRRWSLGFMYFAGGDTDGPPIADASVGLDHSLVLAKDHTMWGAGSRESGQLPGDLGEEPQSTVLRPVTPLPDDAIPAKVVAGDHTSYVISTDGTVYVAGRNTSGMLSGSGDKTTWTEPTGLPDGYVAVAVSSGSAHTSVLLSNGEVWSSGSNADGQLGLGASAPASVDTFTQAVTGTAFTGLSGSGAVTVGLGDDGHAYGVGHAVSTELPGVAQDASTYGPLTAEPSTGAIVEVASGGGATIVRDASGLVFGAGDRTSFGLAADVPALTQLGGQRYSTVPTTITGGTHLGDTLTVSRGQWIPTTGTVTRQWLRNGAVIAGETGLTHVIVPADTSTTLTVVETISGDLGTSTVSSIARRVPLEAFTYGARPEVTGTRAVGRTLSFVSATWSPVPTALSQQWFRNGEPIPGAVGRTYTLQVDDLGRNVQVVEYAARPGYDQGGAGSGPEDGEVEPFYTQPGTITSGPPALTGSSTVGSKLTVKPSDPAPKGVTYARQWLRNGVAISGARASTYTLTASDAGREVSVRVTASRPGYTSLVKVSTVRRVAGKNTALPRIGGTAKVGRTLTGSKGSWSAPGHAFTYQWLRNGSAISGATGTTHVVTSKDKGRKLSLRVTARRHTYPTVTATSASRTVS